MQACDLGDDESIKQKCYKELAESLFGDMPETAFEEKDNVIFYGYLADDQTKFVITRRVEGQITFRLLHPVLPRLQKSAEKMVRKVIASRLGDKLLKISNQSVILYERGFDHIILSGRVIPDPVRETIRSDRKNVLLFIVPLFIVIPVMIALTFIDATGSHLFSGTLERFSTALMTTSLVSALSLFQTYNDIRHNRLIAWSFIGDSEAS